MAGIEQTKELIACVKVLAEVAGRALEDGKINIFDIPKLAPAYIAVKLAFEGAKEVPAELRELSAEEMADLLESATAAVMAVAKIFVK